MRDERPAGAAHARCPAGATSSIVSHLRDRHYDGWYVLEQDTILTDEPSGEGPVAEVRQSADYLRGLLTGH
jgi:inosose dehydratase